MPYINRIIPFLNLLGSSKLERQSVEILIYLKEISKNNDYRFHTDDITKKMISVIIDGKKDSVFSDIKKKPLKGQYQFLTYLISEGFLSKNSSTYTITNLGLNKVFEVQNITTSLKKVFSTIGTLGGFIYLSLSILNIILSLTNSE